MSKYGLICDSCHTNAKEADTTCWNCGHTTFVYEPGNAKSQAKRAVNTPLPTKQAIDAIKRNATTKFHANHDDGDLAIYDVVREMTALITAAQTQLLNSLIEQKKRYITELAWKHAASEEAVPVAALIEKRNELKGE